MTGLVLTGITIGNRIHHHQMLRDIRIRFEQLHDRIEDQDTGRDAGVETYERPDGGEFE